MDTGSRLSGMSRYLLTIYGGILIREMYALWDTTQFTNLNFKTSGLDALYSVEIYDFSK